MSLIYLLYSETLINLESSKYYVTNVNDSRHMLIFLEALYWKYKKWSRTVVDEVFPFHFHFLITYEICKWRKYCNRNI